MEILDSIQNFLWANAQILAVFVAALATASQRAVKSGERGLRFTLGRATNELSPGFYFMVPWFQTIGIVQDRARTLDIPDQRVTTHDGIVLNVDCSVVYRVTDIRKALIEVDNYERGMSQLLPIAVQQVLGHLNQAKLRADEALDAELDRRLSALVAAWGITVESARLTSIAPSRQSLRVTQLGQQVAARRTAVSALSSVSQRTSLGLVGRTTHYATRGERARRREQEHRWMRLWIRSLGRRGLTRHATLRALRAVQLKRLQSPAVPIRSGSIRIVILALVLMMTLFGWICSGLLLWS